MEQWREYDFTSQNQPYTPGQGMMTGQTSMPVPLQPMSGAGNGNPTGQTPMSMSMPMPTQPNPQSGSSNLFDAQSISNFMGATGVGNGFIPGLSQDVTATIASTALNQGAAVVQSNVSKWFSWLSLDGLKPYFHVDNAYVKDKIKLVLFPYPRKEWTRQPNATAGTQVHFTEEQLRNMSVTQRAAVMNAVTSYAQQWEPPVADLVAPDLYLPMMAFVTYVLLRGYSKGLSDSFHPELLSTFASGAFFAVLLEGFFIRLLLFLAAAPSPPAILDILAYSGYKFVGYCVAILLCWTFGAWVFYLSLLFVSISHGVFMIRTYHLQLLPENMRPQAPESDSLARQWQQQQSQPLTPKPDATESTLQASRRKTFLLLVGGLQIVLAFMLVRGVMPESGTVMGTLSRVWS